MTALGPVLDGLHAADLAGQQDGGRAAQTDPCIVVFDEPALEVLYSEENGAIVCYSLDFDGRSMEAGYLTAHMEPTRFWYGDIVYLPADADRCPNAEDIPLLPSNTIVGTGMSVGYLDYSGVGDGYAVLMIVLGDVTGSGQLNIAQLVAMTRMLNHSEGTGPYSNAQIFAADWNDNDVVDIADIVYEARLIRMQSIGAITPADFILRNSSLAETVEYDNNILAYINAMDTWAMYFYYDAVADCPLSEGDILTTARGVQLGDSLGEIRDAYGFGFLSPFDPLSETFIANFEHDPAVMNYLVETAAWWLLYESQDGSLAIEMALDDNFEAILIDFMNLA